VPGRVSGYSQLATAVDRFGTVSLLVQQLQGQCS
jgi:hypothetical protein